VTEDCAGSVIWYGRTSHHRI